MRESEREREGEREKERERERKREREKRGKERERGVRIYEYRFCDTLRRARMRLAFGPARPCSRRSAPSATSRTLVCCLQLYTTHTLEQLLLPSLLSEFCNSIAEDLGKNGTWCKSGRRADEAAYVSSGIKELRRAGAKVDVDARRRLVDVDAQRRILMIGCGSRCPELLRAAARESGELRRASEMGR